MHYVGQAVARLDLTRVTAIGLDETAAKRGHTYVTVFIDLDRTDEAGGVRHPRTRQGHRREVQGIPGHAWRLTRSSSSRWSATWSGAFIAAIGESFDNAGHQPWNWFHVVQLFTKALDEVRRAEARHSKLPKALRWAILKRADGRLHRRRKPPPWPNLRHPTCSPLIAWRIKEKLRWVRQAQSVQAARWRITNFLRHASEILDPDPILDPIRKALATVETHSKRILQRWTSSTQQCPSRRAQRLVPGRQGPCSRISQRHNLRDHDLHDRRAPGRLVPIHLKHRRTVKNQAQVHRLLAVLLRRTRRLTLLTALPATGTTHRREPLKT